MGLNGIIAPGFFESQPVLTAILVGGGAAIVAGLVGVFTVIRGQSFAGHALADVSSAGGSASFLVGVNPLLGFVVMAVVAGAGIEVFGVREVRERDLVTGIVTGAGLGLAALLLYFDVRTTSTTGAAVTVMFGSMFAISQSVAPLAMGVGVAALAIVGLFYRPLLLSSLDAELATVAGIDVRWTNALFLVMLALAVSLSAITIGAVLSTALLVGPAAAALRLASRPGMVLLLAPLIGLLATFGGILLAYDSYGWGGGDGWPVSFCIVALVLLLYGLASLVGRFGAGLASLDVEA